MNTLVKTAAGPVLAATAVIGGANLALADGYAAPRAPAMAAPVDNWSGVYFGTQSGFQTTSINQAFDPQHFDYNSAIVGGHIGVQQQWGAIVLGVEASIDSSFVSKEARNPTCIALVFAGAPAPSLDCTARLDDILSVGGRGGWAIGKWMPYVTGGYANARIETNRQLTLTPSPASNHQVFDSDGERHGGWYIGGGLEWIVTPGWIVGLEYRHYEFDTSQHQGFCSGAVSGCAGLVAPGNQGVASGINSSVDANSDTVMARVSWKWGRDAVTTPIK